VSLGVVIVVTAAVAALLLSPPIAHPQATAAKASSPPTAPELHDYGPPPQGVPLFYGAEAANQLWLTAFDWQGHKRGTIKLSAPLVHELVPEPHCFVLEDPQTYDEVLYILLPGQARKQVAVITREANLGQVGVEAVECNFQADRAIAVRTAISAPIDAWALRLSDGAKLGHWSYSGAVESVVPSSDGTLVAENGSPTRIRSIPDGAILATLPPEDTILGFSDDDRFALAGPMVRDAPVRLIDWRTGREVWRYQSDLWVGPILVEPGRGDLVLAMGVKEQYFGGNDNPLKMLIIVHADGTETDIPGRYAPIFPPYADGYYPYKGGPP